MKNVLTIAVIAKAANVFHLPCRNQPSLRVTHHREAGLSSHASLPRR
jgi:hypothetical protein